MIEPVPICVLVKPPLAGGSKTRIAHALGDLFAARLASALLADTWTLIRNLPWAWPILATTTTDRSLFPLDGPVELWQQGEGDLGTRMERVLSRALTEAGRGILVDANLPGLPLDRLIEACAALETHDAVFGPVRGGFYLVGMRKLPEDALAQPPWSTNDTLRRTELRLAMMGLRPTRIEPWVDLDRPEDLPFARWLLESRPESGPRTLQVLRSVGAA